MSAQGLDRVDGALDKLKQRLQALRVVMPDLNSMASTQRDFERHSDNDRRQSIRPSSSASHYPPMTLADARILWERGLCDFEDSAAMLKRMLDLVTEQEQQQPAQRPLNPPAVPLVHSYTLPHRTSSLHDPDASPATEPKRVTSWPNGYSALTVYENPRAVPPMPTPAQMTRCCMKQRVADHLRYGLPVPMNMSAKEADEWNRVVLERIGENEAQMKRLQAEYADRERVQANAHRVKGRKWF